MKYDVAVIGTGPGGYVLALQAAKLGFKVCAIEKDESVGGTCLNVGCIPSKTLLYYSELFSLSENEKSLFGTTGKPDFAVLMKRKRDIIQGINSQVRNLLKGVSIDLIHGRAEFITPQTLEVIGHGRIEAENIVIATGSEPISLPFLPIDEKQVVSSTGALEFEKVPESLIVIGAGVIGVELASVYKRLGTKIHLVELLPTILSGIDSDLKKGLYKILKEQGMDIHLSTEVVRAEKTEKGIFLTMKENGEEKELYGEKVLVSVGRKPNFRNLGLERIGVELSDKGFIQVDTNFRTNIPHIYAIGDVIEGPMLAHKASYEAEVVSQCIAKRKASLDYITVANVVYTFPEVASVGFSEDEVKALGIEYNVYRSYLKGNARAIATGHTEGFVKIVSEKKTDVIVGMHILSPNASEMISIGMLAIFKKVTIQELQSLPFPHPTLSEAIKEAHGI